jgi:hypothetical protein
LAAAELARIASQKLTVLLPSLEPESDDHLQEQVMGLLREKGIRLKWQRALVVLTKPAYARFFAQNLSA